MPRRLLRLGITGMYVAALFLLCASPEALALTAIQRLGKALFFDVNLSNPPGQSCASCHDPLTGFADPDAALPVSEGVILGRFGNRNAPTASYAAFSPFFHFDKKAGLYVGGQFWDGRAKNLVQQAKGPFVNPVEMNATRDYVVNQVKNAAYAPLFLQVFGPTSLDKVNPAYHNIAVAIAEFEKTPQVSKFNSKYDKSLFGRAKLTAVEDKGLRLFRGKAKCSKCHVIRGTTNGMLPLFTDFTYDNLGIPSNPEVLTLINDPAFIDLGLGASTSIQPPDPAQDGKHKVPTLRNVGKTAPYGHNGFFKTLKDIVHFYNTRDVPGAGWPPPEVAANVNVTELGNLGLTAAEEDAIVAFMLTLSDQ